MLFAAVLVGVALGFALGLFGGGGGILAVPLLLAIGIPADSAGTTSLVVVGVAAMSGVITNARVGRVAWREGLTFAALGIVAAMVGSKLALWAADGPQLLAFTLLMVIAGALMLRKALATPDEVEDASAPGATARRRASWPLVVAVAVGVGLVTGFFGVGGGFLVVPALTIVLAMPMHRATATALLVIAINSAAALVPRVGAAMDVRATVIVTIAAVITTFLAARWSNRWSARGLGIGFAALVLAMSVLTAWEAWQLLAA